MSSTPNDQTSDLMVNLPYMMASGAVHFTGNLAPGAVQHVSSVGPGRRVVNGTFRSVKTYAPFVDIKQKMVIVHEHRVNLACIIHVTSRNKIGMI